MIALFQQSSTCILIHCRNGKDRGALTVYALLRLGLHVSDTEARAALRTRVDVHQRPVANVDDSNDAARRWLAAELDAASVRA